MLSIPTAPIATSFHSSPLTLVTPPVHESAKVVNFYSSVYQPSAELPTYGLPSIHSDYGLPKTTSEIQLPASKTIVHQKPEDIVGAAFHEVGDSIIQTVGSTNQKFEFRYPSTKLIQYYQPSSVVKSAPLLSRLEYPALTRPLLSSIGTGWNSSPLSFDLSKKLPLPTLLHGAPPITTATLTHPSKTIVHSPIHLSADKHEYANGYELSDGTKVGETGHLITTGDGWENVIAKRGHYEYISPEGLPVNVNWIADENGFRLE